MKEYYYEKLLNIHTKMNSNNSSGSISHYHPYEPTPYIVLEELLKHYQISKEDCLVDFGCGFGRLAFFIHYYSQASIKGIEINKLFYERAIQNRENYWKKVRKNIGNLDFYYVKAEEYNIEPEDNHFYFFNPFSGHIFQRVIHNILESVEKIPRPVKLFLYYGHEDYIDFLERGQVFQRTKEIKIPHSFSENPYERILIYRLQT